MTNFLGYVNNGSYTNSVFHRSVPGFIVQGGGFRYDGVPGDTANIPARPAILNEPILSNVTGTIAMAKLGSGSDPATSATNQWFFNLADNSQNLDLQNAGFTAFGEVVGNGMDVVNAIAALPRFSTGAFTDLPLQNYTPPADYDANNLVIITAIIVTDSTADSAGLAGLDPPLNTLINAPPPPPPATGGGGGSFSFFALLGLLLTYRLRRA